MSEEKRPYVVVDETEYVYAGFADVDIAHSFTQAIRRMDKSHSYSTIFQDEEGHWHRVESFNIHGVLTSTPFTWTNRNSG